MEDGAFSPSDYDCPQCGEEELLVRGPRGKGPMTREGPIADLIEDVGGLSPRDFFRQLIGLDEAESVDVRLECKKCDFDETVSADDPMVEDIVNNG